MLGCRWSRCLPGSSLVLAVSLSLRISKLFFDFNTMLNHHCRCCCRRTLPLCVHLVWSWNVPTTMEGRMMSWVSYWLRLPNFEPILLQRRRFPVKTRFQVIKSKHPPRNVPKQPKKMPKNLVKFHLQPPANIQSMLYLLVTLIYH